jgi:S-formylglutathione hydrolase FrmB
MMDHGRYKVDKIYASSLENNPVGSPVERDLSIYLPPDYYHSPDNRYPVIYFLHGYQGTNKNMTVPPNQSERLSWAPPLILENIDWERSCDFLKLDKLISTGKMLPFILVQPDASLHLPDKDETYDFYTGEVRKKGSFYINSKYTGNFEDYIINDVIPYMDLNYHTIAESKHRALMGTSMGGYGTLNILCRHAGKFAAAAALSPANFTLDMLDWKLVVPMMEKALDRSTAEKLGAQYYSDILHTQDMICSRERPLLDSIVRSPEGEIMSIDDDAARAWRALDINLQAEQHAHNLKDIPLLMNCELTDEFGLANAVTRLHDTFERLGVRHEWEIYSDPAAAALSAHIFGIAYKIEPAIQFCLSHMADR